MRRAVGFGAGGHASVILETIQQSRLIEVVGLLDPDPKLGDANLFGIPVLTGSDDRMEEIFAGGVRYAFNGLGGFGDAAKRRRIYERAIRAGFEFITVVHPSATVSPSAELGQGSVVLAQCVVNTMARIGANVIVNTAATVDHHCVIGDHVHLAPGVQLAGGVRIGTGAQIGIGACVRELVQIGENAVVGAGSVVLKDVPPYVLVAGVPARVIKNLNISTQP